MKARAHSCSNLELGILPTILQGSVQVRLHPQPGAHPPLSMSRKGLLLLDTSGETEAPRADVMYPVGATPKALWGHLVTHTKLAQEQLYPCLIFGRPTVSRPNCESTRFNDQFTFEA